MEPARVGEIDDAEAVQKLDGRVAAERHEAPEHQRVHRAGDRPLLDRPPLKQHVDDEPLDAER